MDIVYVLENTPTDWADNEIRYSLRSVDVFGHRYNKMFIIGGKPNFINYNKVNHLSYEDNHEVAEYNVFKKLIYLVDNSNVSEDFILMNDDFYLLKPIDLSTIPYYYKRQEISTVYANQNTFNDMAMITREFLLKNNKPIYDFKPHYPIIYNKHKLKGLVPLFEESFKISPLGLSLRDLYGNWYDVPNKTYRKENKILSSNINFYKFIRKLDLFSGSNSATEIEKNFLVHNFSNKSKWEI